VLAKLVWRSVIVGMLASVIPVVSGIAADPGTLVVAQAEYPFTFDPIYNWSDVNRISRLAYDPLLQYDPIAHEIVPWVAKRWEVSNDGLTYTFWLEEGIQFHDGTPLTASDVKYSVERVLALREGVSRFLAPVESVEIVDDYTIQFKLEKKDGTILYALPALYILSEEGAKQHEVEGDWAQQYLQSHDLGSGPYQVVLHIPEQRTIFEKFDAYWKGWEGKHIDKVVWLWITEPTTQRLLLERGEIDIAMQPSIADIPTLVANPEIDLHVALSPIILMASFRCIHEPLDDVRVRRALAMAIDYDYVVNVVYLGYAKRARGPIPSTFKYYNGDLEPIPFDLEGAKELLAEAGYPEGGFTLKVAYESGQQDKTRTIEMLVENWGALGIKVEPMGMDWMAQAAMQLDPASEPDVYLNYIWPQTAFAGHVLHEFYSGSAKGTLENNSSYWSDPEVDQLIFQSLEETDPDKLNEILREAQELIAEALPAAWIAEKPYILAAKSCVKGYVYNPAHQETLDVYHMWLEGE